MSNQPWEPKRNGQFNRLNNGEFVRDLMNFSRYGALAQVFIIEAIRAYSEGVMQQEAADNPDAIVNPVVWKAIGTDLFNKIEDRYSNTDQVVTDVG